jgi:hypothetical protein
MGNTSCLIDGCPAASYARGWCRPHYLRWKRYGDPLGGLPRYEECTVEGCSEKPYARGWCNRHYLRWKMHGDPLGGRPDRLDACLVEGCTMPVSVRNLCSRHYQRFLKHGDPLGGGPDREPGGVGKRKGQCTIDGCDGVVKARGWCSAHYRRWQRHGDPLGGGTSHPGKQKSGECSIDGCNHAVQARGWCAMHYQRWLTHGDPMIVKTRFKPGGYRHINNNGYVEIKSRNTSVLEHRQVMAQQLGRALYPFENVHHKNGIKTDNDPANLEIWVKSQPSGQRLDDQIAFYVRYYPAELTAALEAARNSLEVLT